MDTSVIYFEKEMCYIENWYFYYYIIAVYQIKNWKNSCGKEGL